jgi:hypothetical protein
MYTYLKDVKNHMYRKLTGSKVIFRCSKKGTWYRVNNGKIPKLTEVNVATNDATKSDNKETINGNKEPLRSASDGKGNIQKTLKEDIDRIPISTQLLGLNGERVDFTYDGLHFVYISTNDGSIPIVITRTNIPLHVQKIGSGGYGTVYRCTYRKNEKLTAQFVLKLFESGIEGAVEEQMFYDEIKGNDKGVCRLIQIVHPKNAPFVVMDAMTGDLGKKRLTIDQINEIQTEINSALRCMYPYQYTDLKPMNILYKDLADGNISWRFGDIGSICLTKTDDSRRGCVSTYLNLKDRKSSSKRGIQNNVDYALNTTLYLLCMNTKDVPADLRPKVNPPSHSTDRNDVHGFYLKMSVFINDRRKQLKAPELLKKVQKIVQNMYRLDFIGEPFVEEYINSKLTGELLQQHQTMKYYQHTTK